MIAMTCEQVAAESLPAVMCLDDSGVALFATSEGYRLCDRWNSGLQDADLSQSSQDFRLPGAIGELLDGIVSKGGENPDLNDRAPISGLRLRHPALPELAVTVELSGSLPGGDKSCYLLVFASDAAQSAGEDSPERRKALDQLTPSERKVALLVTEGLRNGEIAERLQRSRRTIEYQLNAIYRKLDLSCRTQLVRALV